MFSRTVLALLALLAGLLAGAAGDTGAHAREAAALSADMARSTLAAGRALASDARSRAPARTAQQGNGRQGASTKQEKCEALGRCRDAFARCKAQFVKENGAWDLEKEPCGAEYKLCIRKNFAPGEMFFTRWFWPYEECP